MTLCTYHNVVYYGVVIQDASREASPVLRDIGLDIYEMPRYIQAILIDASESDHIPVRPLGNNRKAILNIFPGTY